MRLPYMPRVSLYARLFIQSHVCLWMIEKSLTPRIVSERNILIPSSTAWCQPNRTNGFIKIPLSTSDRIPVTYSKMTRNSTQIHWDSLSSHEDPTKSSSFSKTKGECESAGMNTYHPINFFRRYSNVAWGKHFVQISPSCSVVAIFNTWIPRRIICSLNQCVLTA